MDLVQKNFALTCKKHIISWSPYEFASGLEFGTIHPDTEVVRIDRKIGLLVRLPQGKIAYANASQLVDGPIESPEKKFKIREHYICRVVGFDYCDGMVHVSFQKSVLSQPFLRYQDIQPGQLVQGHILKVDSFGMLIALSETIRGLCPTSHLADVVLGHSKKFKIGANVTCRVLSIDPKNKKLLLTHKKTLVESTLPILSSYDQVERNSIVHGYISGVKDFGCIIRFYGEVKGIIRRDRLGIDEDQTPSEFFEVGAVVKCRVISVNSETQRLGLSFDLIPHTREANRNHRLIHEQPTNNKQAHDGHDVQLSVSENDNPTLSSTTGLTDEDSQSHLRSQQHQFSFSPESLAIQTIDELTIGMLVEGFVRGVSKNGCFISINPNLTARVKICELSDSFILEKDFTKEFPSGMRVKGRIIGLDKIQRQIEMSLKMSVVDPEHAKKPLIWNDLKKGMIVTGLVKAIQSYGLFIKLNNSVISGLCHISEVGDDSIN